MIEKIPHPTLTIAEQILRVQLASYQVEADLINYPELPPLRETAQDIVDSGETFLVYRDGEEIVAAISYEVNEDILHIGRLVVSPTHFRRVIARQLLYAVENTETNISHITVGTGAENRPAITLYEKQGFSIFERFTLPDGLQLVKLEKILSNV